MQMTTEIAEMLGASGMNGPGRLGLAGLGQPPRTVHAARTAHQKPASEPPCSGERTEGPREAGQAPPTPASLGPSVRSPWLRRLLAQPLAVLRGLWDLLR